MQLLELWSQWGDPSSQGSSPWRFGGDLAGSCRNHGLVTLKLVGLCPCGSRSFSPRCLLEQEGGQETSGMQRSGFFPSPRSQPLGIGTDSV